LYFVLTQLNPIFLWDLHQGMLTNEHQYVTKMTLSVSMGGLWKNFNTIFWIIEYLQRPIYIWNKVSKCIMFQCGMEFQSIPLNINYSFQHFEPIQYVNGLINSLFTFQINDPKVTIHFKWFFISFRINDATTSYWSQLITHFYWNENFDFTLMDILKDNWD